MPKITDTYQLAYTCCETILKELNRFPTIDLIRERIGVNSPNTIKKAMNDWTASFAKQYIEQQQSKMHCPEVPNLLTDAVYQLWKLSVNEAEQLANTKIAASQIQLNELQNTLKQQHTILLAAQQDLNTETFNLATAQTLIENLNHEKDLIQTALIAEQQKTLTLTKTLEEQSNREIALKEQHVLRLQQEQDWMQRRILEERELAAEKWQAKQQPFEERLYFLKSQVEQALQSQALVQKQNQQLLAEITLLKEQVKENTSTIKANHKFKRNREFPHR